MFEPQQQIWQKSDEHKKLWVARRAWIGVAFIFLGLAIRHFEHLH